MARCVSSHTSQRAPSGSAGNDAESRARCRCMAMAESAVGSRTNSEEPTRWCLGLCPGSGGAASAYRQASVHQTYFPCFPGTGVCRIRQQGSVREAYRYLAWVAVLPSKSGGYLTLPECRHVANSLMEAPPPRRLCKNKPPGRHTPCASADGLLNDDDAYVTCVACRFKESSARAARRDRARCRAAANAPASPQSGVYAIYERRRKRPATDMSMSSTLNEAPAPSLPENPASPAQPKALTPVPVPPMPPASRQPPIVHVSVLPLSPPSPVGTASPFGSPWGWSSSPRRSRNRALPAPSPVRALGVELNFSPPSVSLPAPVDILPPRRSSLARVGASVVPRSDLLDSSICIGQPSSFAELLLANSSATSTTLTRKNRFRPATVVEEPAQK